MSLTKVQRILLSTIIFSGFTLTSDAMASSFSEIGPAAQNIDTSAGVSVTLNVANSGIITDLNLSIETSGPYSSDIDIFLISPSGTNVHVYNAPANNYSGSMVATFDDESSAGLASIIQGSIVGVFLPDNPLSVFDGEDILGTWTLFLQDNTSYFGDGDDLLSWSIFGTLQNTTSSGSANVPEPNALVFLITGIALLMLRQKGKSLFLFK